MNATKLLDELENEVYSIPLQEKTQQNDTRRLNTKENVQMKDANHIEYEEKKEQKIEVTEQEYNKRIKNLEYPPLPTKLLEIMRRRFEKQTIKEQAENNAKVIRTKLDVFIKGDNNELCQGDERLRNIFKLLNSMGYVRSPDQVVFHFSYIMACLPLIYKSDWPKKSVKVMKSYRLKCLEQLVLVLTPRRIGKTVSVAMFVTALLLCIPGLTIAVFSTCQRASTAIMTLVAKIMSGIQGSRRRILSQNKETLQIGATPLPLGVGPNSAIAKNMANTPSVSVLNCFPASENSKYTFLFLMLRIQIYIYFATRLYKLIECNEITRNSNYF